jgi:hypothetical protein
VDAWPANVPDPAVLSDLVSYVGSGEHKARPVHESYDLEPALRSDASRCDPSISREEATAVLRESVARRNVSSDFEGSFPRYVWGWLNGRPHVARLINREKGEYKGWPIAEHELPIESRMEAEDA